MAKRHRQIQGDYRGFEVSEQLDDHLLPSAEEIAKYKEADPSLPQFIQETAKKEQELRHNTTKKGIKLSFREQILQHGINYYGVTCAFIMGLAGMWYSYKLLEKGHEIGGSIFGGGTLIYMAYLFLSKKLQASSAKNK